MRDSLADGFEQALLPGRVDVPQRLQTLVQYLDARRRWYEHLFSRRPLAEYRAMPAA